MIEVRETTLPNVRLITQLHTTFEDYRGLYLETWNAEQYESRGIKIHWLTDDISISRRNVLRGIHGDGKTWKLISCLQGAIYVVVADRVLCKWEGFTLSDHNHYQLLVPPGYGNGHLVLTEQAIFHYKQSEYYDREGQFTIAYDDPDLDIDWPLGDSSPILSKRDSEISKSTWDAWQEWVVAEERAKRDEQLRQLGEPS